MGLRIAILTAGSSLRRVYDDELFPTFDVVYAINCAGRDYRHHFLCVCDRPNPMFGYENPWYEGKTLNAHLGEKKLAHSYISQTFPRVLRYCDTKYPKDEISVWGWDNGGARLDGVEHPKCRWDTELNQVSLHWDPDRMTAHGDITQDKLDSLPERFRRFSFLK